MSEDTFVNHVEMSMEEERRQSENGALRELVDSLKTVIAARDELWAVGVLDRLFRVNKYKKVLSDYDNAVLSVRNAIQAVMAASKHAEKPELAPPRDQSLRKMSAITLEEFSFLLGKPGSPQKVQPKSDQS